MWNLDSRMDETTVAIGSIVVTVALFAITQVLVIRSSRQTAKAELINQVLTALEAVARVHSRPVVARLWTKPELEYALLVPRLLVGLGKKDRVIAVWVRCQVDVMLSAPTQGNVIRIASTTSAKLAEWQLGERSRDWFAQEVKDFVKPKSRTSRRAFATSASAVSFIALTVLSATLPPAAVGALLERRWKQASD